MKESIQRELDQRHGRTPGRFIGWIFDRLQRRAASQPRLELLERINLAPRQSLALIEAEGRRLLVATSPEGTPAFYSLDGTSLSAPRLASPRSSIPARRVSW